MGLNVGVDVPDAVEGNNSVLLPPFYFFNFIWFIIVSSFNNYYFIDPPKPVNTKPSGLMGPKGEPLPLMGVNVRAKMVR